MPDVDLQLDDDGDLGIDPDGGPATVSDMDVLRQDIRHRLLTVKGSLAADPDYGGSLPLFLHMPTHPANRRDLINTMQSELAKETRILPQRTVIDIKTISREEIALRISFVRASDLVEGSTEVYAS